MAMATSHARLMIRATGSTKFLNLLFHPNQSRAMSTLRTYENPFQISGPRGNEGPKCFDLDDHQGSVCVTVDMPGVSIGSVEVKVFNDRVIFNGKIPEYPEYKEEGSEPGYVGDIDLNTFKSSLCFVDKKNIRAQIKNGVLRIFLPYNRPSLS